MVEILSGILRFADGLDRTHRQRIRSVSVIVRAGTIHVRCRASGEVELEMWGADKRLDLIQRALGLPVKVIVARAGRRIASAASRVRARSGRR